MNFDKKLLALIKNARFEFIATIVAGISVGLFTIFQSKFLSGVLDAVFLKEKTLDAILTLISLFFLFGVLKSGAIWTQKLFASKTAEKIKSDLRKRLSEKIFALGPVFTKNIESGKLSAIVNEGVEKLDAYYSSYLPQFFLANIIPVLILIFVFPIDLLSGFVFLVTGPVIPFFMILIGKQAESLSKKQWKTLSYLSSHFFDVIQGLTTLKLFGQSKNQIKKISEISDEFRKATLGVLKIAFLSALVLEVLSTISIAIVSVEVGLRLLYGKIEFYDAFFVLLLAPEFYLPMRLLGSSFHAGIDGVTASKSIFEILDAKNVAKISGARVEKSSVPFAIEFREVAFEYRSNTQVLKNISFKIEAGEKIALVGKSGAGKSTLLNLLLKFIEPTRGEILAKGGKLSEISRESWLRNVTYLSQHPYLFHGSVRENLLLAKPNANDSELFAALEFANIENFVRSLPQVLDTPTGERGAALSGGQVQRIALARAYLKNAPILLLDEPTANLDPEIEEEISAKIFELMKNKTVITIAHRLKTIENSDKIVVLQNGEIAELGTHEELLQKGGVYATLLNYYAGAV
jgi:ATP-binding cassette subfamily C protein CydD